MLNIPDLEKRWIKYKIKSFIPYVLSSVFFIALVLALIIYYPFTESKTDSKNEISKTDNTADTEKSSTVASDTVVAEPVKTAQNIQQPANVPETKEDSDKLVLKPSLNFVNDIEDSMITYYDDKSSAKKQKAEVEKKVSKPAPKPKTEVVKRSCKSPGNSDRA